VQGDPSCSTENAFVFSILAMEKTLGTDGGSED